jgi:hypothetical protein
MTCPWLQLKLLELILRTALYSGDSKLGCCVGRFYLKIMNMTWQWIIHTDAWFDSPLYNTVLSHALPLYNTTWSHYTPLPYKAEFWKSRMSSTIFFVVYQGPRWNCSMQKKRIQKISRHCSLIFDEFWIFLERVFDNYVDRIKQFRMTGGREVRVQEDRVQEDRVQKDRRTVSPAVLFQIIRVLRCQKIMSSLF